MKGGEDLVAGFHGDWSRLKWIIDVHSVLLASDTPKA